MLLSILAVGLAESGIAQREGRKLIGEDRAGEIALTKVGAGRVEFIERRGDNLTMVYEAYVMQGNTLFKTIIDSYTGVLNTIVVDSVNGRCRLQARMLSKKRAELAAKATVAGEVTRWRLKYENNIWCYRFQIETAEGQVKEVYVDERNFKVLQVKAAKVQSNEKLLEAAVKIDPN
jgi:uncharacterized membrane protein YkoI